MEGALIDWAIQNAPVVGVLLVLVWRLEKRQDETQVYLQELLNDCWARVLSRLPDDTQELPTFAAPLPSPGEGAGGKGDERRHQQR